jgi:hypothetical protein
MITRRRPIVFAAFSLFLWPALSPAQYPVDQPAGQVDNRVGGELYGNNTSSPSRLPYQVRLLPSEERYAIWRSGVLPSELNLARSAAGPLTPNGVIDFLPQQSPLQRAMGLPASRLYNPAYDPFVMQGRQLNNQVGQQIQSGYPQTFRQGMRATTNVPGHLARNVRMQTAPAKPGGPAPVPSLMPAPDQPLPTGQLSDDVNYDPNSSPGAILINRPLNRRPPARPAPATKPASLSDEQKAKGGGDAKGNPGK